MREIIFRGKRIDNGEWVEGFFIADYIHHKSGASIVWAGGCVWHEVAPETVGQFTGLLDKNGKKIFDGDVVEVDCSGVSGAMEDGRYKVEYVLPDCGFLLVQIDEQSAISFNECYIYEIIGNIHDQTNEDK